MARPSKLTDKQWVEIESLARNLPRMENNEKSVILQLKVMLIGGDFCRLFGVCPISRYRFEYALSIGRVDLMLFHRDGGISIIEAKPDECLRTIVSGIGQLFLYSSVVRRELGRNPKYINRILCAPTTPEKSSRIFAACEEASVRFVPLASYSYFKEQIDGIKR